MAIQTLAAESYLLGEMTPDEREEFEQHFFDCAECAQDLRDAIQLMDAAKTAGVKAAGVKERLQPVLQPASSAGAGRDAAKVAARQRFSWLPPQFAAGAIGVLAAACIAAGVFIPTLERRLDEANAPRVASSAFLVPQTRGSAKMVKAASGAPVILMFDLPDSASGPLQFVLKGADGRVESRLSGQAPPPGQSVTLSIPRMDLAPGDYMLVVEAPAPAGQDGQELSRYPFELQRP